MSVSRRTYKPVLIRESSFAAQVAGERLCRHRGGVVMAFKAGAR